MPATDHPTGDDAGTAAGDADAAGAGAGAGVDRTRTPPLAELDPLPLTGTSAPAAPRPYAGTWDPAPARPAGQPNPGRPAPTGPEPWRRGEPDRAGQPDHPDRAGQSDRAGSADRSERADPADRADPPTDDPWSRTGYQVREPVRSPEPAGRPAAAGGWPPPAPRPGADPVVRAAAARAGRTALVVAILGAVLFVPFLPVGAVLGIAAVVLGARALRLAHRTSVPAGRAGAALTIGIITTVFVLILAAVLFAYRAQVSDLVSCGQAAGTRGGQQQCLETFQDDIRNRLGGS